MHIESKLEEMDPAQGKLYRSGEYEPLLNQESSFKIPRDYIYAFVSTSGATTEEVYYTKDGTMVEAFYKDKKIKKVSGKTGPKTAYFFIPIVGLLIVVFSAFREALRTGNLSSWKIGQSPDRLEKIYYLYGIPLFAVGIFIVIVKEVWLKGI